MTRKISPPSPILDDRRSRQEPPPVSWSEHAWPHGGIYGDQFWSALLRLNLESLHTLVYSRGIPHTKIGRVLWVDATDMKKAFPKTPSPRAKRN